MMGNQMISFAEIHWELILGGLGLFLFGINIMGDNLTHYAGAKIRTYIDKYTSNPFMAVLVGIILTGAIQSSSATTVITISLVRAGLMKLEQAIGVTIGANIGTTVTAILIGFDVGKFAFYILFIGVLLTFLSKKKKTTYLAHIIIGFSLIFIGLELMGDQLKMLQYIDGFESVMIHLGQHPIIALVGGSLLTGLIQSSSALIGIIQKLYDANAIGILASIALVFGSNIGTCITSILASIGGSLAARRASLFHLLFNVIGAVVFLFLLQPYSQIILWLSSSFHLSPMMTIAMSHFLFNLATTILVFPFIRRISQLMKIIIPGKDLLVSADDIGHLDEGMVANFPAGALESAHHSIVHLGEVVIDEINKSQLYLTTKDRKHQQTVIQIEQIVNEMDTKITSYLLKVAKQNLSDDLSIEYSTNLQVLKNIERISDLAENLVEFYEQVFDANEQFNDSQIDELKKMYELLVHNVTSALEIYRTHDITQYHALSEDENYMDLLESTFRDNHLSRLTRYHTQATVASSMYVDVLGTLERMGDHGFNIATMTIDPIKIHSTQLEEH